MPQQLKIAKLDATAVARITQLESQTGAHIMAFEPGLEYALLDADALATVRALEDELGVILLVYTKDDA